MVCISHSDNIAKLGLLLAINPDTSSIGSQAAQIAEQVLQFGKSPESIGVQTPIGTNLTLNARTAKKIGVEIPDHAVQIANKVIQ